MTGNAHEKGEPSTTPAALVADIQALAAELNGWDGRLKRASGAAFELDDQYAAEELGRLRSHVEALRVALSQLSGRVGR